MEAAKCAINGSDYIGVFATASDKYVFLGHSVRDRAKHILEATLKVTPITLSVSSTDMIGLFMKANSNGIIVSNLMEDHELAALKHHNTGLNIAVLQSSLNAIGNNILANDKIALVNPDYDANARQQIRDTLGVEVIACSAGGFKTTGANNILTNSGFAINNRADDPEKDAADKATGFESVRTTANTGSLNIGLSVVGNSNGVVAGGSTTGFELNRIIEALNIDD